MEIIKFFIQFSFAKRFSFSFYLVLVSPKDIVLVLVLVTKISLRYTLQEIHKIHNKLTVSLYITSFTAGMHSCSYCITV